MSADSDSLSANKQANDPDPALESGRLDRWLWCARLYKTRTMASRAVASTPVRINGVRVKKPAYTLRTGDVVTLAKGTEIIIYKVIAHALRRGSAPQAQLLFEDLSPPRPEKDKEKVSLARSPLYREKGMGRPTKRERRKIDGLQKN